MRDLAPELDALAIGLPAVLVVAISCVLLFAAYRRSTALTLMGVSLAVVGVVAVGGPWLPERGTQPLDGVRLVAANVAGSTNGIAGAPDDLWGEHPDVLVLTELDRGLAFGLEDAYEHAVMAEGRSGVWVFSRWPLTRLESAPDAVLRFGVGVQVAAPDGSFVVYALHLPRPWPNTSADHNTSLRDHHSLINSLVEGVRAETGPVVIAGDLNLSDRTSSYRTLTSELKDAMRTSWARPTSIRWSALLLRIDHILVPADWCAAESRRFRIADSDHYGISSLIGRCDGSAG